MALKVRVQVTAVVIRPVCPYCKELPVPDRVMGGRPRKTCGRPECQFRHHIKTMREKKKTERVLLYRRIDI